MGSLRTQSPIGLTCAWLLACHGDMSCAAGPQSPVSGAGRLASLRTSRDATEAGPRRIPTLVACGGLAVGTEKSRYQQHVESYDPGCERLRCPCPGLVKMSGSERGTLRPVV